MQKLDALDDESLMALIALGEIADPGRELVLRHQRVLFNRLVFFVQGNQDIAADLAQKIWEKVLVNAESNVGKVAFKTYLHLVARKTFIDWLRANNCGQQVSQSQEWDDETTTAPIELTDELPFSDTIPMVSQDVNRVREALYRLSPIYREALILRYMEDRSVEEVAELTGQQLDVTRTRLRYAKPLLRTLLERDQ